jgi:trk system potassium uptake protein TrkH
VRGPGLNWKVILPVITAACAALLVGMVAPLVIAFIDGEGNALGFIVAMALAAATGIAALIRSRRLPSRVFRPRDGFVAVVAVWIVAAVIGGVPFLVDATLETPTSAFFESMSGFTTTGATMIADVEAAPRAILLWRSISQWLGGVGIVVLVVAIAPATGLASQRFFFAETSGITPDRLTPRIASTAKIIWGIYAALTLAAVIAYFVVGMSVFDAVNHGMTTLATGGFSTRNASIASFDSTAIDITAIAFMVLGGVNFAFYWRLLRGGVGPGPQLAEVRTFLIVLAAVSGLVAVSLVAAGNLTGAGESALASTFAVVSLMTTTGFTTVDFDLWNDFARSLLLGVMFIGGCAGSTAGGMKVIRVMLLAKSIGHEVRGQFQPQAVRVLRLPGRGFSVDTRRNLLGFVSIYLIGAAVSTLVMTALGVDLLTSFSSVAATLNVVGPGLGDAGALENYSALPDGGLWLLSLLMLMGRLEIFTVLVLLVPAFWRRSGN